MLLTVLEIVAFMAAAAIIGVVLGWVLRGTLGREQAEVSELRGQLRKLKKANRESKAAQSDAAKNTAADKAPADNAIKDSASKDNASAGSAALKSTPSTATTAARSEASDISTAKPATKPVASGKQADTKKASKAAKTRKKTAKRKSLAEREADQAAGVKAFAEVSERLGKADAEDKLTKIYGVGKKYESMLNELGVTSYLQISRLKKADVRSLAAALGVLDDRLESEDWVGSAKKLLKS